MLPTVTAWGFTLDLGLVLLLFYVLVLWLGGWLLKRVARAHFHRAERYAHTGFAYDMELDRYECPQGELLTLHTFDDRNKLAIYKAPASTCNDCVLKAFCARTTRAGTSIARSPSFTRPMSAGFTAGSRWSSSRWRWRSRRGAYSPGGTSRAFGCW